MTAGLVTQTSDTPRLGEQHLPLHERVRAEIRKAILTGELKPGDRLVEDRLAEVYGVSRNPVREAIRGLATEGLVEVLPRRGALVARMAPDEARETIEVRALLEGQTARLAARRRDPGMVHRARDILARGDAAMAEGHDDLLAGLNLDFHRVLAEAGRNSVLSDLMIGLRDRTAALFADDSPARRRAAWADHAAILEAVIAGDEDLAAQRATAHVLRAGEAFLGEG
ncbi:GntR family transcriptional regulator [uncultured Tistrella sp.]|uniref:GntR family transcriptional regulator n=1 Tax=Tistrella mobilis TaxID=171437 RepID=UPI000C0B9940|nr:GntR family transcriptional regulator [uncultured Tistrella sp.]MAM72870.1 GntR family transcriptional regulator [Tistrella sp.]